ncbi:STAS domain-containing protein [Jatrophihabitans fulvus]
MSAAITQSPGADDTAENASTQVPPPRRRAGMSVDTVRFDDLRALVRVVGDLDMATVAPLAAVLRSHLDAGRRFLRLDVSGVRFVDATALAGIVAAHEQALAARGTLVITGVRSLVGRVLRMSGLDRVLLIGGPRADDDLSAPR